MRIDSNGNVGPVQGVRSRPHTLFDETAAPGMDSAEFSARAADIRVAMEALDQVPEVREELVARLRQQLEAGSLATDAEALAAKLLEAAHGTGFTVQGSDPPSPRGRGDHSVVQGRSPGDAARREL